MIKHGKFFKGFIENFSSFEIKNETLADTNHTIWSDLIWPPDHRGSIGECEIENLDIKFFYYCPCY